MTASKMGLLIKKKNHVYIVIYLEIAKIIRLMMIGIFVYSIEKD